MSENNRHVVPNPDGGWEVRAPAHRVRAATMTRRPMRSTGAERSSATPVVVSSGSMAVMARSVTRAPSRLATTRTHLETESEELR